MHDEKNLEQSQELAVSKGLLKFLAYIIFLALLIALGITLAGCAALPQFFSAAENIADDTAIRTEISKEAIQKETDLTIHVEVRNKDPVK